MLFQKTIEDINLTQILKDKLVLFEIQRKLILKRHRSAAMGSQCTTEKVKNLRYVMPIVMVPWCTVTQMRRRGAKMFKNADNADDDDDDAEDHSDYCSVVAIR